MVNPPIANPYVGPQPMRKGDAIYGRDREISELRHFLVAERIVLLYSPSGAGESSLIQAGVVTQSGGLIRIWGSVPLVPLSTAALYVTNRLHPNGLDAFLCVTRP